MADRLGVLFGHILRPAAASVVGGGEVVEVPALPQQRSLADIRSQNAEGRTWAKTELGSVHYRLYNKEALAKHALVVLVHGFSIPGVQHMASIADALASRGLPVLVLDLFGRGLSDRPLLRYDGDLYSRCVVGLLAALGLDHQQVDLLGFSMGGQIIQEILVRHPKLVRRMVFCAPAGANAEDAPAPVRLGVLRYGVALMTSAVDAGDISWTAYYRAQYGRFKAYGLPEAAFKTMMAALVDNAAVEFNGFAYSLGSSLADFMGAPDPKRLAEVGRLNKPSIAVWGTADTDVPYKHHKNLLKYVPHCVLHSYQDKSHMFLMDKDNSDVIRGTVADFLLGP